MTDKFIIRIAIAAIATLIIVFAVVGAISYLHPELPASAIAGTPSHPIVAVPYSQVRESQTANPGSDAAPLQGPIPQFQQPIANAVTASDLRELAMQVDLKNSTLASVDKTEWKKALPKAQQLLQGACDCEGRNWLNHFVETGNYAIAGSKQYDDSAKFLSTLPKDDEEATTHHISD